MKQCSACRGLVPESIPRCPNCAVSSRLGTAVHLAAGAALIGLIVSACSPVPMPAYGVACTAKQIDGGNRGCFGACDVLLEDGGKPSHDPNNGCFNDAGIP